MGAQGGTILLTWWRCTWIRFKLWRPRSSHWRQTSRKINIWGQIQAKADALVQSQVALAETDALKRARNEMESQCQAHQWALELHLRHSESTYLAVSSGRRFILTFPFLFWQQNLINCYPGTARAVRTVVLFCYSLINKFRWLIYAKRFKCFII